MSQNKHIQSKEAEPTEHTESKFSTRTRLAVVTGLAAIVLAPTADRIHDNWQERKTEHAAVEQAVEAMNQLEIADLWNIELVDAQRIERDPSNPEGQPDQGIVVRVDKQPTEEFLNLSAGNTADLPERFLHYADKTDSDSEALKQELEEKNINEVFWMSEAVNATVTSADNPEMSREVKLALNGFYENGDIQYELPGLYVADLEGDIAIDLEYTFDTAVIGDEEFIERNDVGEPIGTLNAAVRDGKIVSVARK